MRRGTEAKYNMLCLSGIRTYVSADGSNILGAEILKIPYGSFPQITQFIA
jgi:hypothetical protein